MAASDKKRLAARALSALRAAHHARNISVDGGGMMDVLVLSVISHGAPLARAKRCLVNIKKAVVNWNELRVTPPVEVAPLLKGIKDAQAKAAAIHDALVNIFEGTHDLELRFLDGTSAQEARDFFAGLGALSEDIVAEIILSGRGHFLMAADTDIMRVARRLELCGNVSSPAKCQEELEQILSEEKAYQAMYLMKELSELVCNSHSPRCTDCALLEMCRGARKTRRK